MPGTYHSLATVTLSTAATTMQFSSISQAYTDLVLVASNLTSSTASTVCLQFNGDTAANYSRIRMSSNGSTFTGYGGLNNTAYPDLCQIKTSGTVTAGTSVAVSVLSYTNASNKKSAIFKAVTADSYPPTYIGSVLWYGTAAISSITVYASPGAGYTFNIGATATLYGILRA